VDDDEAVCRVVVAALQKNGYATLIARDGSEALPLAIRSAPAVVISDLRLPGIDGHTLMRRAKAQGVSAAFVVMSGSKDREDVIDALRNGASDYLSKPFTVADLLAAVARAIDAFERNQSGSVPRIAGSESSSTAAPAPPAAPAARQTSTVSSIPASDPIFAGILRRVHDGEILIPSIPAVVLELRGLLASTDTTMEQIASLIERDQRIAAQVLRVSNTVQYARGAVNTSIKTAISRLGLRQVQSLVETIFARSACVIRDPDLEPLQSNIWRFSVARAVSMRVLAETMPAPRPDPEIAYLAGLFADVGASFLLWVVSERNTAPGAAQKLTADTCLDFIRQNHQAIGAAVLSRWAVDPTVALLAKVHHSNTLVAPINPYLMLEIVAIGFVDQIIATADVTASAPRDPDLVKECTRRFRLALTDAVMGRMRSTYEAIVTTLD
jgi:HD-like signal output (HDOD) protein/CheY-like chemotaxis protein